MAPKQIARLLGIKVGTVYRHHHELKERVRAARQQGSSHNGSSRRDGARAR
jgi:DNA-directed RNA polymerase specialized sigma24 family protein